MCATKSNELPMDASLSKRKIYLPKYLLSPDISQFTEHNRWDRNSHGIGIPTASPKPKGNMNGVKTGNGTGATMCLTAAIVPGIKCAAIVGNARHLNCLRCKWVRRSITPYRRFKSSLSPTQLRARILAPRN